RPHLRVAGGRPLDVWPARLYGRPRAGGGPAPQLQLQAGRRRAQSRLLGRRQRRDRVPPQSGLGRACRGSNRGKLCRSRGVGTTHQGGHLGRRSAIAPRGGGIVSKRKDSAYRSGRSPDWLKMKNSNAPAVKREAEEDRGRER